MLYEPVVVVFISWGIKINILNTELQFCTFFFCSVSVSEPSWVLKLLLTTHKYYKYSWQQNFCLWNHSLHCPARNHLGHRPPGSCWGTLFGGGGLLEWQNHTRKILTFSSFPLRLPRVGSLTKAGILPPRTLISNGARQWIVKSKPPYETSFLRELVSSWEDIPVTINWKCHRRIPSHVGFLFFLLNSWCFFLILTLDFGLSHSNAHFCFLLQCYQQQENCLQQCHSEEFC